MNKTDKTQKTDVINNLNKNYKQFSFDFIKNRNIFFIITAVIFVVGLVSFFVRGFNWDIDFVGGTIMEFNIGKNLESSDLDEIRECVVDVLGSGMVSSVVRSGTPPQQVIIKSKHVETEQRNRVYDALSAKYDLTTDDIYRSFNVNPTVGAALTKNAILSVSLAALLMLLYITVRFEVRSGIASVLCLIFDLYVMLAFYSLFQVSMDSAVIAAFLTILGYSINATIITFDRVRENVKLKKGSGMKFNEIVNISINQTLARSINTTLTVLMTIACVMILGVASIRTFVLPLFVGISSGMFSSICLSGPLWDLFTGDKEIKIKG